MLGEAEEKFIQIWVEVFILLCVGLSKSQNSQKYRVLMYKMGVIFAETCSTRVRWLITALKVLHG